MKKPTVGAWARENIAASAAVASLYGQDYPAWDWRAMYGRDVTALLNTLAASERRAGELEKALEHIRDSSAVYIGTGQPHKLRGIAVAALARAGDGRKET